ncbi:DEAD/DEAH box helicase [Haloechinothrix salitolerans]|uniref:DEAD/DEAH box helicase n=1 Tax=Haloechinothrix salitolerans TaxID=926830 RepID=A0ABW2CBU3_9PSEU
MSYTLDPLGTSRLVSDTYRRYLRSLLPVCDPDIAAALAGEITSSPMLTNGPFLEATPPFAAGASLRKLIDEGVIDGGLSALSGQTLPLDRPLYQHQELAIRKAAAGRNLVVATGTGSGKTESFLLPILSSLVAERAKGTLGPGVRALLLYPMNALANDQLKRLRQLLAGMPEITFGRYTGDTRERAQDAAEVFEELNPGEPRRPNELLSREEMRVSPPHLLLTNYAMLEYLLLRPADLDLFEGEYAGKWRFIALDEAHVYDGAKAEELAMLLRRLRDRVAPEQRLQCFATSATVGSDPMAVVNFAQRLFDAPFDWADGDPNRQDVVTASRVTTPEGPYWGPLVGDAYQRLAQQEDPRSAVLEMAGSHGFTTNDPAYALAHEATMAKLRGELATGPQLFDDLATKLFGNDECAAESLAALVTVGSQLADRAGSPLLSARYHQFARATEGAFCCLTDAGPHVSLSRHEECTECAGSMFELGACKRCGAVHLIGAIRRVEDGLRFVARIKHNERRVWLLVGEQLGEADEDDVALEKVSELEADEAYLCATCGLLYGSSVTACTRDGCTGSVRHVRKLKTSQGSPSGCLACGARGPAMIRQFESGGDAAVSVLSTALYQSLPPATDDAIADRPGEGRKLLMFSDSRQSAAFFAPYLEDSYSAIQRRRLVLQGFERATRDEEEVGIDDLIFHVARVAGDSHVFERRTSKQQRERKTALWVMQELVAVDERQSLEGLGLLRVRLDRAKSWQVPSPLLSLGLKEEECWSLLAELVRTVRQQGVLTMPEDVDPRDEAFDPRRGPIFLRKDGSEPGKKVLSWLPTRGANRRLDYLQRVLDRLGVSSDARELLDGTWKFITSAQDGWLKTDTVRNLGAVRQVDHTWLQLSLADQAKPLYRCSLCRKISSISVKGICTTIGCEGVLEEYVSTDSDDHYRTLYRTLKPIPLVAREHTAQWTSMEAASIQQRFLQGDVNALSCSTTFELGVDVGELQSVVLRNMPPTTANYVQRAGRAGRRTDSAALVVTYAQRRSHDLSHYQSPRTMISGEVRAPYVPLGNERIDRRHAHSIALAAFFRTAKRDLGEQWRTAGEFFLAPNGGTVPCSRVRQFLTPVPPDVLTSLRRVLPADVQDEIGVDSGKWVAHLADLIEEVRQQLDQDVAAFEERRRAAFEDRKDHLVQRYARTINTLTKRHLLGFLANRNILPKYGFPVDTVELRTTYSSEAVGSKLELARDLSSAIYEYAPGAEVVAGGYLWKSGGVYRLPDRELEGKYYMVCEHCQHYYEDDEPLDGICPACSHPSRAASRQYCVPEFGFVAEPEARRSTVPPKRSWNGTTHVVSTAVDPVLREWQASGGGVVTSRAGERGQLIAISEGPNGSGYLICDWCGWGCAIEGRQIKSHPHLLKNSECRGPLQARSLAHKYETDVVELSFDGIDPLVNSVPERWLSGLFALLEGASSGLEISRDDIGGALYHSAASRTGLVIFDTVPGGAGGAMQVAESLDVVTRVALDRVTGCDCGEETSCYGCLRNFGNQRFHDELSRRAAIEFLEPLAARAGLRQRS